MLRNIRDIAFLYLRITYSSPGVFIFQLLMPLVFTFVLAVGTSGFADSGESEPVVWPLHITNEDEGTLAAVFIERLEANPTLNLQMGSQAEGLTAVEAEEANAALIIPTNFTQNLQNGHAITLDFHVNADSMVEAQPLEQAVLAALSQVSGSLRAADVSEQVAAQLGLFANSDITPDTYRSDAIARAETIWETPPVLVESQIETRLRDVEDITPSGANQSSPGMVVMYAMFTMLGGAVTLIQERQEGTLRRLVIMPVKKVTILTGKIAGVYISGIIQMGVLIIAGILLFNVAWGQSPLALLVMVVSFAFAITSLGMVMASFTRTLAQANSLNTVIILAMASLGGAWWPIDIVPQAMQTAGHFFPTAWAMDGFHDIITRGFGVTAVLPEALILLGYGILFLAVSTWRFRYE